MNNDELQKAIDDITRDNTAPVAPVADVPAENEKLADELTQQMASVAPQEAAAPEVDLGAAPAPEIPDAPGMPPVPGIEAEPEPKVEEPIEEVAPVQIEETPAVQPVAQAEPVAAKDEVTLNEALKELYPLLDKVELPVKEKFDITMKVGEPAKALDYAKQIQDEAEKANALLEIVNKLK